MSKKKQSYKRKNYFIKKDFQTRFILKFCLLLLAGVVISTSLLFLLSQNTLTSTYQHSRLVIQNTSQAILPAIVYTSLITLVLLTIATIIVTLFISHKIAGPMFRFEKEIREIGGGNLTKKVTLRNKDQAAELAECINDMTAGLREKVVDIQNEVELILEAARQQNAPQKIVEGLANLHKETTKKFTT